MKILAIDIGAGTQDIMYYDDAKELENSIKLVLPSPPVRIVQKIRNVSGDIYFDGDIMGGGKIKAAIMGKIKEGYDIIMEQNAAKTIKDDLNVVKSIGIKLCGDNIDCDGVSKKNYTKITLKDIDIDEISSTMLKYDLDFSFDQIAIAVQDHGFSEAEEVGNVIGDRDFRFEKIKEKLDNPLAPEEFAYYGNVPEYFTRMKSVERAVALFKHDKISFNPIKPILMDSKFASICGACYDEEVSNLDSYVVMDIGNGHTMAASIENNKIQGVFEHHTNNLAKDPEKLENLVQKLVNGTITHEEVHQDNGHGAYTLNPISKLEKVVVTGPKRAIIRETSLDYYNAAPGGDVMMTGPVGLIKATEYVLKNY